jgi:hypothetical protein
MADLLLCRPHLLHTGHVEIMVPTLVDVAIVAFKYQFYQLTNKKLYYDAPNRYRTLAHWKKPIRLFSTLPFNLGSYEIGPRKIRFGS